MATAILAIDPGKAGGMALFDGETITSWPMPETDGDTIDAIVAATAKTGKNLVVVVERVGGYVKTDGGKGQPGSAMFRFGFGVGLLHGAIMALGLRLELVTPQRWQARLGVGTRSGRETHQWKTVLKAEAQRRFPTQKVTLKTADALLMLDWAMERKDLTRQAVRVQSELGI